MKKEAQSASGDADSAETRRAQRKAVRGSHTLCLSWIPGLALAYPSPWLKLTKLALSAFSPHDFDLKSPEPIALTRCPELFRPTPYNDSVLTWGSRVLVACSVVLLATAACSGDRAEKPMRFDGQSAMRYAQAQMQFGPRVPGTPGAQRAGDWIITEMRARADTVIVQSWTHTTADGKQLPMRNILARFRPGLTNRILYLTHWDTRPVSDNSTNLGERQLPVPGANDGASGVALFVALADALKRTPPAEGVDLLFVDGEDYGSFGPPVVDALIGSTYFASHPPEPGYKPMFGVLWDMIGDADLVIKKEPYSIDAAPEVVERVWRTAAELGHDDVFVPAPPYGYGITDDHLPLIQAGMRVIDVIDLEYAYHHRPTDTIDKISARSLSIVGEVAEALLR